MDTSAHPGGHSGGEGRRAPRPARAPGPTLWAVASGKGGVGKSVVSASLAVGLAATGPRAVAVDLDLGGANLHDHFGCARARHTVGDVLRGRVALGDALVETSAPGVRLLSGARAGLDAANPSYAQKHKLLRALRRIDAGHVVIDLGAGSSFNVQDAFVAADRRILVTTAEAPALENACHFLKAAFFRSLREVARDPEVRGALAGVLEAARREGASPRELVDAAARGDPAVGSRLRACARGFDVDLVVNRCEGARDPGAEWVAAARAGLGANLSLAASLPDDAAVPAAVARGVPVLQLFPGGAFSDALRRLVARLIADEPVPVALSSPASAAPPAAVVPARRMPGFDGVSPGRHLRACRELAGWSRAALHERTRIRHHHLANLEEERYEALPPDFYLRAYVRQIADALGLPDGEWIAACFVRRAGEGRRCAAPRAPDRGRPGPLSPPDLVALVDFEPELDALPGAFAAGADPSSRPSRDER